MQVLHSPEQALQWLRAQGATELRVDSRQVQAGQAFIAWPGAATDGRRFVRAALAQGAVACLVEREGVEALADWPADAPVACYAGLKAATGPLAALWWGQPSQDIDVLAITGTNGKTSTAWWLAQALSALPDALRRPCAMIGTLGTGRVPQPDQAGTDPLAQLAGTGMTTPDPVLLQSQLRRFIDQGFSACALEASSIGVAEHRLDGCRVRVALFTNFTQDHLDYHGSMAAYWAAKAALFAWPGLQTAVINVDDEHGAALAQDLASRLDCWTVSLHGGARLNAQQIHHGERGLSFVVQEGAQSLPLNTALMGRYNVSNLLGVIATLRSLGVPLADAVQACQHLLPVPGRMDCRGGAGQPLVVVDYAHTPDALEKALRALRPIATERGGRLCCVFGCGGDRDATKRPLMAAVAEKEADWVMVTSDNPRFEKPEHIISQVLLGLSHRQCVQVQADRAAAIQEVLAQASAADVVLVAGKGHEAYQETAGVRHPFSDHATIDAALRLKGGRA
ncbi:UDP-N-acetylmuramoyl-L-alanyl-D-glutamate--2,6-diaminopimelate ligase [Curvibacter sp. HBC28]|uniref:UDP-N-acetylmuramoyl-L-alanyl-D-glutamate--2,6-diaminopimelate ligase n=1 Tax=Curvibacter microcysteis TaxID=3026419 RepID=A0ABT5MD26_9BURK|nr:UDP-N-acetylmuramoyl-L-alanyl-D-glutamate--2,6-diaminopimelate ligase [Curvibacter sp. HBC28]MDD0813075.1 UDP-N-acetylmuramoyl-L-alanyl-D-glutamate--2,6-diaminopimelate ligase [Curvibacter sp. HBC28]